MKHQMELLKTKLLSMGFYTASVVIALTSCTPTTGQESSVVIATEKNDAKFNSKKEEDADFLVTATEFHLEEIQCGNLAQRISKMTDIQQLGKMMEEDHTTALKSIRVLAEKKSISIPTTLSTDAQGTYQKLMNQTGDDFDKAYSDITVKMHEEAQEKFVKAATNAEDKDVRAYASSLLPIIETHLNSAKICQKRCEQMQLISKKPN
jgi:putative membrane protein